MSKVFGSVMNIPGVLPIRIILYPGSQKFSCKVGQGGRGIHEFILFLFNKIEEYFYSNVILKLICNN